MYVYNALEIKLFNSFIRVFLGEKQVILVICSYLRTFINVLPENTVVLIRGTMYY